MLGYSIESNEYILQILAFTKYALSEIMISMV